MINLSDNSNMISITQFSELFNCSKANSKSILDRMVKLGVLYKDKKNYLFTVLGEKIAKTLVEERDKLESVLCNLMNLSKQKSREYANSLACEGIEEFTDKLSMYYQYCKLIIDEKPHILLSPKNISKSDKGFLKKGILQNISYPTKNGDVMTELKNGDIKIPFDILRDWYFIEKNTLQCGIYLNTHSKIGFFEHNKTCLFVFTINLLKMF